MKVLVACEYSGTVRDAFLEQGHDAMSCDFLPTDIEGPHYQGDCMDIINDGWDLMICHPPCTKLTVAQAWTFYHPEDKHLPVHKRRPHPKYPDRLKERGEAVNFCKALMNAPINMICMENPIGFLSSLYRKPDQIIQPYNFGHDASKSTCLWLKNLPKLKNTLYVPPRIVNGKKRWDNQTDSGQNKLAPNMDRWKVRSETYKGIALAMANQWGNILNETQLKLSV